MRMKKKAVLLLAVCILCLNMQGCDPFQYPFGMWVCEELGLTLDFDDTDCLTHNSSTDTHIRIRCINGRGTLLIDGELRDVVALFNVNGGLMIGFPNSESGCLCGERDGEWIFDGQLSYGNRGKNRGDVRWFILRYTLVKVTPTESEEE